jgi:hypothetical protein
VSFLPRDAGDRGGQGGEASGLEVLWLPWNPSPEFHRHLVRSGRRGSRCPGPWETKRACQGGAQFLGELPSAERRARGGVVLPGVSEFSDDNGGSASSVLRSLVAKTRGRSGGSREERERVL